MPTPAKPLFRPEALPPPLKTFAVPPPAGAARPKLGHWAKLLGSKDAERMKETELLADFIRDVFGDLLGYTGPASGSDRYTIKREKTIEVDGKFADAALGRFQTTGAKGECVAALEGKGPRDPLDRPFAGRKLSAVDQALRYAVNLVGDVLKQSFKLKRNPMAADEWEPYLTSKKAEVEALRSTLANAEAEINDRVYKLFQLTHEEVKLLQREVEH